MFGKFHISPWVAAGAAIHLLPASESPLENPPEPPDPWNWSAAAGLTYADGNAQSLAYQLQILATRKTDANQSEFGADYFQARDQGSETTNSLHLFGHHQHNLSERTFLGLSGEYRFDKVADLDHRADLAATLGYRVYQTSRSSLSFELGPGWTWEQQAGQTDSYPTIQLSQKYQYLLNTHSKFTQSITYTPEIGDFDNSLLTAEANIDVRLTDHWALRTGLRYQHDNTPAAGRESGDLTILSGLTYSLSGYPEPDQSSSSANSLFPAVEEKSVAPMGWDTEAAIGYSLSEGNADQSSLNISFDSAHRTENREWFLNTSFVHATAQSATSTETLTADSRYQTLFTSRSFGGIGLDFRRDALADLAYRITPGVYLGHYLIKSDATRLSLEVGPGYTLEKRGGIENDFAIIQVAQRFRQSLFASRASLRQEIVAQSELADPENFTLQGSIALDTRLNNRLSWRNELAWQFDNAPATGRDQLDTTLTSGLAMRF